MNILVIGEQENLNECRQKFGDKHDYSFAGKHCEAEKFLNSHGLVIDFIIDEEAHAFEIFRDYGGKIFLNTAKISLSQLAHSVGNLIQGKIFGFNGLPTFLLRSILEVSVWKKEDEPALHDTCRTLEVEYKLVDDRVGLVTPRVICMIINEAYYVAEEGTALREDIDLAMKLGTNYPFGPFEWCQRIGIKHVYELLQAVYDDTKDERYKICPLLRKEYLHTVR